MKEWTNTGLNQIKITRIEEHTSGRNRYEKKINKRRKLVPSIDGSDKGWKIHIN